VFTLFLLGATEPFVRTVEPLEGQLTLPTHPETTSPCPAIARHVLSELVSFGPLAGFLGFLSSRPSRSLIHLQTQLIMPC
jgi:hypothetical protein